MPPPGFPTLRFLRVTHELKNIGVRVLQFRSRAETMVVKIVDHVPQPEAEGLAQTVLKARAAQLSHSHLGKACAIGYPYLMLATVGVRSKALAARRMS